MGTRSIVGVPTNDGTGFRGRYVHWDGYPAGVGQAVADIVRRDGYSATIHTLIVEHSAWSSVTGNDDPDLTGKSVMPGYVPGYGVANDGDTEWWVSNEDNDSDCQYAYAILATVILVWQHPLGGSWTRMPDLDIKI